ncbi:MAG: hypothetical protein ACRDAQ_10905 [Cetobacterium sp.]
MSSIEMSSIENYKHDENIEGVVPFENLRTSTQTFTVKSNILIMDLQLFFEKIDLLKNDEVEIVNMKYKTQKKGVFEEQIKKRISKKKVKSDNDNSKLKRNFLNCVSIVALTEKKINIKVFKNGVFQITGCRKECDVTKCINIIFTQLKHLDIYELRKGETFFVILVKSAMRNVDFNVNYTVNREILSEHLRKYSKYNIPPLSSKNMGVKMKTPFNIKNLPITKIEYRPEEHVTHKLFLRDCIDEIEPDKTRQKAKFENKFNNATIFQNGKVLMSCVDETFQKNFYYWIADLLMKNKSTFEIIPQTKKTFRF